MSESPPSILGGMIKTGDFELRANRGENRRQNETNKSRCFNWVIFQIAEK